MGDRIEVTRAEMERAVASAPHDPSLRFLLGIVLTQEGRFTDALEQQERGSRLETSPFRRGQLLLWGARLAAASGNTARATEMRAALKGLQHPDLSVYKQSASREASRPLTAARLRRAVPNFWMVDAM